MKLKTIEDVAHFCLTVKIGFHISFEGQKANHLVVMPGGEHVSFPFKTASYHAETGELILMSGYPEFNAVSIGEVTKYYLKTT